MIGRTKSTRGAGNRTQGGTTVNVLTGVIFFGLLAMGIWWVFKQVGDAGQQYTTGMINTTHRANDLKCQINMRTIWQSIQMYAMSNEEFPASQERLVEYCGDSRVFRCDEPNAPPFEYIPGQTPDMPPSNVLVYEPVPAHEGRSTVLFLGGQIALLTPEELKPAVEATIAGIKRRR